MEFPDSILSCFRMENEKNKTVEVWGLFNDLKIQLLITDGKVVSHYLTSPIKCSLNEEIVGIDATNENYIIYSRDSF